jgi:hypothetical protein
MMQTILFFLLLLLVVFPVDSQQPSLECSCPVPAIFASAFISEGNKVTLREDVLEAAMRPLVEASSPNGEPNPLQVLSVVGTARKGKSSTMNMQVQSMVKPEVWNSCEFEFATAHSQSTFTMGMWLWAFTGDMMIDGVATVFIDTQGLEDGADHTSEVGLHRMMAFAMIVPDLSVFLVDQDIKDSDLVKLGVANKFASWIDLSVGNDNDDKNSPPSQPSVATTVGGTTSTCNIRMPSVVVMYSMDVRWAQRSKTTPDMVESREDNERLESILHSIVSKDPLLYGPIWEMFEHRWLLVLPQAYGEATRDYRHSPLHNRHLLPEVDPTYLQHRKTVASRVTELLRSTQNAAKLPGGLSVSDPRTMIAFWRIIADAVNKEHIVISDAVAGISAHKIELAVEQAADMIAERLEALCGGSDSSLPLDHSAIENIDLCLTCKKRLQSLKVDSDLKRQGLQRVDDILQERTAHLKNRNTIALNAMKDEKVAASMATIEKVYSDVYSTFLMRKLDLMQFLLTHTSGFDSSRSIFTNIDPTKFEFSLISPVMKKCVGCLDAINMLKPKMSKIEFPVVVKNHEDAIARKSNVFSDLIREVKLRCEDILSHVEHSKACDLLVG